ncbi:uncharacterized mitochondrial protein-like protein [Tanacetum coccineum]
MDTSLIHIESRKSPTKSLFDVGSRRISIVTVNTKEYHSDVLAIITRIMHADYAGCKDTFKSNSGGVQFLGEKQVSWSSKKQDCTVLSNAEAEYVSLSACCAQVIWMRT